MTTLSYFKQNLLEIEQKLRGLQDTDQNSIKIRMDVMTDLYCVLHSKQAVTYFMSIYRRTGAHNATIAKDIEDYISEAWTEAFRCYDPNKGTLLPFLAIRIQNKIIDDERKMGGMVGLPRNGQERAKLNFISVDQDNAAKCLRMNLEIFWSANGCIRWQQRYYNLKTNIPCKHGKNSKLTITQVVISERKRNISITVFSILPTS